MYQLICQTQPRQGVQTGGCGDCGGERYLVKHLGIGKAGSGHTNQLMQSVCADVQARACVFEESSVWCLCSVFFCLPLMRHVCCYWC